MTSGIIQWCGGGTLFVPRLWWVGTGMSLATTFGCKCFDLMVDALYKLEGTAELTCTDLLDLDCKMEQLWAVEEGLA